MGVHIDGAVGTLQEREREGEGEGGRERATEGETERERKFKVLSVKFCPKKSDSSNSMPRTLTYRRRLGTRR